MKKCQNCGRAFGDEAYGRHILFCTSSVSPNGDPSPQHVVRLETGEQTIVRSDEFMEWLKEEFVHNQNRIQRLQTTKTEAAMCSTMARYVCEVNPSPRILFQSLRQDPSNKSVEIFERGLQRKATPPSGAWRVRKSPSESRVVRNARR